MLICKSSVKIKAYNKITDILIIKIDIVHKIFNLIAYEVKNIREGT